VLTNARGDIFLMIQVSNTTRIARYLPDGRLDSSYGNAGYSNAEDLGYTSAALQGDKIIVAGSTGNPDDYNTDFTVIRYTAKGALDTSFGQNGKIITDFDHSYDYAWSIATQGDKIIVGGNTYY